MSTVIYRRLDQNGDPVRGAGLANFLTDIDAVAQMILTRIKLLRGEWFEDLSTGTPLFQSLLGVPTTKEGVALIMTQRILTLAPYVTAVQNVQVTYTSGARSFTFSANVQTIFGTIAVTSQPAPGA